MVCDEAGVASGEKFENVALKPAERALGGRLGRGDLGREEGLHVSRGDAVPALVVRAVGPQGVGSIEVRQGAERDGARGDGVHLHRQPRSRSGENGQVGG